MKNLYIYLSILSFFLIGSCDDNLDLAPVSQLSPSTFYQTEIDFEQALTAAYRGVRDGHNNFELFTDVRSDNTIPVASGSVVTRRNFDIFALAPDNEFVRAQWNNYYNSVARINAILDRIDDATFDENTKGRIKAEAQFLRGFVYFYLVRIFENVPLILNEVSPIESLEISQSTPSMIYSQIVSDLTAAANVLPSSFSGDDVGRATSAAANGLLGKVHLTNGNMGEAVTALRKVTALEGFTFDLLPNFADVFDQSNEYNAEIIFAMRYSNDGLNGNTFNYNYTDPLEPFNRATGTDLYDEFEPGDLRRDHTLNIDLPNEILIFKFGTGENGQGESDLPIIRYADVLLMLSEALNEQGYVADGEAFTLINRVRTRAGLAPLTAAIVTDQAAFRLAMEHERRMEFVGEHQRWFDLVRTGRFIEVMTATGKTVAAHQAIVPIPEVEIFKINDEAVLKQNPGY